MVFKGMKLKKSHDLEELCNICSKYNKFTGFMDECTEISTYYIETRYPLDIPFGDITKEDAKTAVEICEKIYRFVLKDIDQNKVD